MARNDLGVMLPSQILDPRRQIDCPPHHGELHQLSASHQTRYAGPAVQSDSDREWGNPLSSKALVVPREFRAHGKRGMDPVVPLPGVGLESAKEREDAISDERRNVAPAFANHSGHTLEVSVQDAHELRRLHAFTELCKANEIGEQNRDFLLLTGGRDSARDDLLDHLLGREATKMNSKPV